MDTRQIENCVRIYWNIERTKIVSSLAILAEGHVFWIIINSEHMVDIKPDPKSSEETGKFGYAQRRSP